jgi:hypothetical protein
MDDHRLTNAGSNSPAAHCPVVQIGAGVIANASVDVRDFHGSLEVSCFLDSRDRTGVGSFSTSPPAGTGAAFMGPKSLKLDPVTVFPRGSIEVRCILPPTLGTSESSVMSYAVTQN